MNLNKAKRLAKREMRAMEPEKLAELMDKPTAKFQGMRFGKNFVRSAAVKALGHKASIEVLPTIPILALPENQDKIDTPVESPK